MLCITRIVWPTTNDRGATCFARDAFWTTRRKTNSRKFLDTCNAIQNSCKLTFHVLATLPKALDTEEKYKPIQASLNVWARAPASLREYVCACFVTEGLSRQKCGMPLRLQNRRFTGLQQLSSCGAYWQWPVMNVVAFIQGQPYWY